MKQKLMKILLLYSIIGTLFVSCNLEEEYTSKKGYQEKMKISHVKFNELLKDKKFSNAYGKVQDKRSLVGKTVMEQQYNFTIADKPVKVLESAEGITYTILINRTLKDNTFFENLVVEHFTDGEVRANIIKYTPFQPNNVQSYFSDGNFFGNTTLSSIIYNASESSHSGKFSSQCYSVCTLLCYDCSPLYDIEFQVPHPPKGSQCKNTGLSCEDICEDFAGGGGPIEVGSGGGTPSDNNNDENPVNNCGNCNVPVYTAPVLEEEDEEKVDPCVSLKASQKVEKENINPILQNFKSNLYHFGENATRIDKIGPTLPSLVPSYSPLVFPVAIGSEIELSFNKSTSIIIHTHPYPNTFSMFSWGDMNILLQMGYHNKRSKKNIEELSFMLVTYDPITASNVVYAVKIDNIDAFDEKMQNQLLAAGEMPMEQKIVFLNNDLKAAFEQQVNTEKAFLEYFQGYGVSLYQAEDDLLNWKKLEKSLDPLFPNTIIKTPCNN